MAFLFFLKTVGATTSAVSGPPAWWRRSTNSKRVHAARHHVEMCPRAWISTALHKPCLILRSASDSHQIIPRPLWRLRQNWYLSCAHRPSPWSSRIRGPSSCRCCTKSHYINLLVAPQLRAFLWYQNLQCVFRLCRWPVFLSWLVQKFFFRLARSFHHSFLSVCQSFFFQLIIRSSFFGTSEILRAINFLYPPGYESLVKKYNNECTLKSSDDASTLRWTYRFLRHQRWDSDRWYQTRLAWTWRPEIRFSNLNYRRSQYCRGCFDGLRNNVWLMAE